jgi:AMMECR1 domain-containing protein/aromatic ring-opening dioxygenase LigB subunit
MPSPICSSLVMCHAPIVIPGVAGPDDARKVKTTTSSMAEAARLLVEAMPDRLVILAPHAPRELATWSLGADRRVGGNFARFGAPEAQALVPGAPGAASDVARLAADRGLAVDIRDFGPADHSTLVPLYFAAGAGWNGPTLVIGFPYAPSPHECDAMGRAIADAARARGERWAIIASGDASHRLIPGAPSGYHPRARSFDSMLVRAVDRGDYRSASRIPPELRELAAEDILDSIEVAAAAADWQSTGHRTLSYEGPFGVGYLVSVLFADAEPDRARPTRSAAADPATPPMTTSVIARRLTDLARRAIWARLHGETIAVPPVDAGPGQPHGLFVTLRSPYGALRGCLGHIGPVPDLGREIADLAVAAATNDTRFPPVIAAEVPGLVIELSLLGPLEETTAAGLDPTRYGVVVSQSDRQGVLLPGLDSIRDVDEQLAVACRKGQIDSRRPFTIRRFAVTRLVGAGTDERAPAAL